MDERFPHLASEARKKNGELWELNRRSGRLERMKIKHAFSIVLAIGVLSMSGAAEARTTKSVPPRLATVTVHQSVGCCYVEGALSYLVIRDAKTGRIVRSVEGVPAMIWSTLIERAQLAPGNYSIKSWQRPCDANCDYLDAPTDVCEGRMHLERGSRADVKIRVEPGRVCNITTVMALS